MIVMRDAPYTGMRCRERLDLILMALAFELKVSAAFVGAGVLQLLRRSDVADPVHDCGAALGSLSIYGIDGLYAEADALRRYGIEASELRVPVTIVDSRELAQIMHRQDLLL